jgi:hypothetical protein
MTNIIIKYDGLGPTKEIRYQFDEKQSLDKQLVLICEQLKCIGLPSNYTLQSVTTNNILQPQVSDASVLVGANHHRFVDFFFY